MAGAENRNLVSLREYVDEKFAAMEKAMELANDMLNARMDSMNQFREELRSQAAHFLTREECGLNMDRVKEDIRFLRESRSMLEGKASQLAVNITFILALIGMGIALVNLLMKW